MEFKYKNMKFKIVKDFKECFNEEAFIERYAHVLDKYDVIVGDISAEMLRLKGFYNDNTKVETEFKYKNIKKYLRNSCAYECPHYIVKRVKK